MVKETPIDVWRFRLLVASEMTNPMIEIVHGDEEDVGLGTIGCEKVSGSGDSECGEKKKELHGRGNVRVGG